MFRSQCLVNQVNCFCPVREIKTEMKGDVHHKLDNSLFHAVFFLELGEAVPVTLAEVLDTLALVLCLPLLKRRGKGPLSAFHKLFCPLPQVDPSEDF